MAPAANLIELIQKQIALSPEKAALLYRDKKQERFLPISWKELDYRVRQTALGLHAMGVRFGDRIGILSENRPEWIMADLGILSLGAVVVPIYPTLAVKDTRYIIANAGIKMLFLSPGDQAEKSSALLENPGPLEKIIFFDDPARPLITKEMLFSRLLESGAGNSQETAYENLISSLKPDVLATLIYTSGTTGPPKGVMLTHRNFLENVRGAEERIKISSSDLSISFLPLSHVFERLAGYYFMMAHGAPIAYARNMQTVVEDMKEVHPTVACAVPRFYEKFYARVLEKIAKASPLRKKIFYWAVGIGKKRLEYKNRPLPFRLAVQYALARLLVFKKIKAQLGGRLRFFISGSAPLSKELAEFFYALDILILEGYGLTETSPVIAVNSQEDFCFGTVGRPLKNVQVRIAEDGEILTAGPCVMQGYYQNPEATREAIKDGWFHTGDVGCFTEEGFLKITDRKKDIIKTSGGKMVSPQNIEGRILEDPLFSQVIVIGDKRNYLTALVVPNRTEVEEHVRAEKLEVSSWEMLLKHPAVTAWIETRFREKTKGLASFEQIKYYALLPNELSLAAGEITPTLKIKRRVVCEKYKSLIEELYQKGEARSSQSSANVL